MLALMRSSFTGLSLSWCADGMGRGSAEDGGRREKQKARSNGGKRRVGRSRQGWIEKKMLNTNDFIHLILLGYPGVIQLLFVFKDKIDFYMATRH